MTSIIERMFDSFTHRFPINWGDLSKEEQIQENNESNDVPMDTEYDQNSNGMASGLITQETTESMIMTE